MDRTKLLALGGALVGAMGLWTGWGLYVRSSTDPVPYTTLEHFDGVELREYPDMVAVETTAETGREAFRRLFDYIEGGNQRADDVAMTTPVATSDAKSADGAGVEGTNVAMTSPVATTDADSEGVTMRFYLPGNYTYESAPRPTNDQVDVVRVEAHRVAVVSFGWYATDRKVEDARRRLFDALEAYSLETTGEPYLLLYDDPWTPPWMRRNEIVVPVAT